jgi:hypothetical protein
MHSFEHVIHGIIFGIIAYFVMISLLKQDEHVAQDRSILLASVAIAYMVLFGHGLPTNVNKNIF